MILTLSCLKLFELKLRGMKNIFFYIYYDYGMNKTIQKTKKKKHAPGWARTTNLSVNSRTR